MYSLYRTTMPGVLVDDTVVIEDQKEGSQLHNRGSFGYPRSGGGLDLDLVEATFLAQSGKVSVESEGKEIGFPELFRHSASVIEEFDIKYLVYSELRSRGFIVKPNSGDYDLRVYARGDSPSRSRERYWVKAVSERSKFDIGEFFSLLDIKDDGRELVYGVVDEEGDITYYAVSYGVPKARCHMSIPAEACQGHLVQDRVIVFNERQADALMDAGMFGKKMGDVLQLSIIESAYLSAKEALHVISPDGVTLDLKELLRFGEEHQDEFAVRKDAYFHLRDQGLIVKTGFKYGTHFRMYEEDPDKCHARYLVHATSAEKGTSWPEISRAVRLAHGVKKEILFSMVGAKGVELLGFRRIRP